MKQIQKIIKLLRYSDSLIKRKNKAENTKNYLMNSRKQYVSSVPVGFKSRGGSDFFFQ